MHYILYIKIMQSILTVMMFASIFMIEAGESPAQHTTTSEESTYNQNFTDADYTPNLTEAIPFKTCESDMDCYLNQYCNTTRNERSRSGLCSCKLGFIISDDGNCFSSTTVANVSVAFTNPVTQTLKPDTGPRSELNTKQADFTQSETITSNTSVINITEDTKNTQSSTTISPATVNLSTVPEVKRLTVSAGESNQVVQLPENTISISAYAVPPAPSGETYKYEWTLLKHPSGNHLGNEEAKHTKTLQLSNLKEGLYTFKVVVSGRNAVGDTIVNISVEPPKRENVKPVAVISPSNSTVQLPNTDAVLDGSQSTDDQKVVKYHWDDVLAPIGYKLKLTDTATLHLTNLTAGFYQFRLTVTDSNGATNSTKANITVLKATDYPPVANAGEDVVVFLPTNEYVLNGNKSMDDKIIKMWEWTKSGDTQLAVDMQGTQTPYLHLSNLQKGMYKFALKVTDASDQSGTAEVHVFVKEEQQQDPPVVDAGSDLHVNLTTKVVVLDGSRTKTGQKSTWKWTQLSGPNAAVIEGKEEKIVKLSRLTVGRYEFKLEVVDGRGLRGSDSVVVTVNQFKNKLPKANGGGDKTVTMPANVVILNGSLSTDDRRIVSYKWTRDSSSLAAGEIIENSDHKAVLKMVNLIVGRYMFTLTVKDEQGESSSDTVSLIVKNPIDLKDEVQLILDVDLKSYTQSNKEMVKDKLALLLSDGSEVKVAISKIFSDFASGRVVIVFVVYTKSTGTMTIMKGPNVVIRLKEKLGDENLFDFNIVLLETVVCQNSCSDHGSCEPYTKRCICDAFWMENFFRFHVGDKRSNCEWSILYVVIIIFVSIISCVGFTCLFVHLCRRQKRLKPKKRHRYTLLDTTDEGEELDVLSKGQMQKSSLMVSESDSDSDNLFERTKLISNGNAFSKSNGVKKPSRRVKT